MLEISEGNILKADVEAIVNTVNCVGVMGKGIALQFKQAYPDNFKAYYKACKQNKVIPGKMFIYDRGSIWNPKYIINFPTKRHWKGKSHIEDIKAGLKSLVEDVKSLGIKSIAIPPLGCGNGGLDWNHVRKVIESAFGKSSDVKVLLYEPKGALRPDEMLVKTIEPKMTRGRALLIRLLELYRIPDYKLSLLEVQKLAYFLQCTGELQKLNFVKHKYGPYANNLNHVLERIEGHFIRGFGDRSSEAEIYLIPETAEKVKQYFLQNKGDAENRLERVGRLIEGFETPYGMELLSSVHWAATHENKQAQIDPEIAVDVVHEWNSRKRNLFPPEHIIIAWKRLKNYGWI